MAKVKAKWLRLEQWPGQWGSRSYWMGAGDGSWPDKYFPGGRRGGIQHRHLLTNMTGHNQTKGGPQKEFPTPRWHCVGCQTKLPDQILPNFHGLMYRC